MNHIPVVIGASAGGIDPLVQILSSFSPASSLSFMVVLHLGQEPNSVLSFLQDRISMPINNAEDKESIEPGFVYLAPAGYHLLIEHDFSLSLSLEPEFNHARPAIDLLFDSASDAYGACLNAIILSGAGKDGSWGMKKVISRGGRGFVQDPGSAVMPYMPRNAAKYVDNEHILSVNSIIHCLQKL